MKLEKTSKKKLVKTNFSSSTQHLQSAFHTIPLVTAIKEPLAAYVWQTESAYLLFWKNGKPLHHVLSCVVLY